MKENNVVKRIGEELAKRGWTYYRLSKESGMNSSTVYNMLERGTVPEVATLEQIAAALGMTMAQFFSEEGSFPDLTPRQQELLRNFEELNESMKIRAEAYIRGLLDAQQ